MAYYRFTCKACGIVSMLAMHSDQQFEGGKCKCGGDRVRTPNGATSRIVEVRDNGLMSRRVEQLADIERINYERAHQDPDKDRKP